MTLIECVCAQKKQWSENLRHMKDGAAIRPYNEVGQSAPVQCIIIHIDGSLTGDEAGTKDVLKPKSKKDRQTDCRAEI